MAGTENRIATARKDYNDAVQDYNTSRARFPTVISAKLFGFKEEPYFRAEEGAAQRAADQREFIAAKSEQVIRSFICVIRG